jgi:hypothetical protein
MKLVPALIMLYVLMVAILIFDNVAGPGYDMDLYNGTSYNITDSSSYNSFWQLFINPTKLGGNTIWLIIGTAFAVGVTGIALSYVTKSDLALLLSLFILVFSAGIVPIIAFYLVINRELWVLFYQAGSCAALGSGGTCGGSLLLASLVCGPLSLYWLWVCIEWWSARSAT